MGSLSLLQGIFSTKGSKPGLLHCRWTLYQLSHQGSPKNTGVGSLSFLQWIVPTQESNQGPLHCRWILYQLSYQGILLSNKQEWTVNTHSNMDESQNHYDENIGNKSFSGGTSGTESACHRRRCGFDPWVGKIPWRRAWQPTPVFMLRESHRQRSLAGYSP